jgi:heptosyltransferase-2
MKDISVTDVLIVHTWGLGDMILLTPVLSIVHNQYPEVRFSFLIFQKASALPIINAPYTQDVYYSGWKLRTLFQTVVLLQKQKFQIAMFSSGVSPIKAGLFLQFVRAKIKIGEYCKVRFPFLHKYSFYNYKKSRVENNYSFFRQVFNLPSYKEVLANKDAYQFSTKYYLSETSHKFWDKYLTYNSLQDKEIICIHPGCMAKNKYRRWPKEYFIQLINLIKESYNYSIVVIGGPDEKDEAEYISHKTNSLLLMDEPLDNVASIISHCSLFINTDSGLGHVASCFDIKTLTIFGPGDEKQTAPFSVNSHIIRLNLPCAPCIRNKKRNCNIECLISLEPNQVFNEINRIIN